MEKHFVTFYSPGSFFSEETTKEIDSWDVEIAKEMARNITERHSATPYAFRFITKSREFNELDSKITKTSNLYHLGGNILTLEQVKAKNDPEDKILISNMESNKWNKIIVNTNSWRQTSVFGDNDILLDW